MKRILMVFLFVVASCAKTPVVTTPQEPSQVSAPQGQEDQPQDDDGVAEPTPTPEPEPRAFVPHGS